MRCRAYCLSPLSASDRLSERRGVFAAIRRSTPKERGDGERAHSPTNSNRRSGVENAE
jgi:hypothetical protein